jgi:rhodanese-related sulfurtransferase
MKQKIIWFLINQFIHYRFRNVKHITVDELKQWLNRSEINNPLLLDARANSEYQISHLKHALPIGEKKDSNIYLNSLSTDHPIVVYCSIGYRSAKIVEDFQKMGYTKVFNLTGSIFQWISEGYDIFQGQDVSKQIHTYNKGWERLLNLMLRENYTFIN